MNFLPSPPLETKVALHNEVISVMHDFCPRALEVLARYSGKLVVTKGGPLSVKGKAMYGELESLVKYYRVTNNDNSRSMRFWISNYGTITVEVSIKDHAKGRCVAQDSFGIALIKDGEIAEIFESTREPLRFFNRVDFDSLNNLLTKAGELERQLLEVKSKIPHAFRS